MNTETKEVYKVTNKMLGRYVYSSEGTILFIFVFHYYNYDTLTEIKTEYCILTLLVLQHIWVFLVYNNTPITAVHSASKK